MSVDDAIKQLQALSAQGKGNLILISEGEDSITGFEERESWLTGTMLVEAKTLS